MRKRMEIEEFRSIYERIRPSCKSMAQAYELTEQEWIKLEGERMYAHYNSWRAQVGKYRRAEAAGRIAGHFRVRESSLYIIRFIDTVANLGSFEAAVDEFNRLGLRVMFKSRRTFMRMRAHYIRTGRYQAIKSMKAA